MDEFGSSSINDLRAYKNLCLQISFVWTSFNKANRNFVNRISEEKKQRCR